MTETTKVEPTLEELVAKIAGGDSRTDRVAQARNNMNATVTSTFARLGADFHSQLSSSSNEKALRRMLVAIDQAKTAALKAAASISDEFIAERLDEADEVEAVAKLQAQMNDSTDDEPIDELEEMLNNSAE